MAARLITIVIGGIISTLIILYSTAPLGTVARISLISAIWLFALYLAAPWKRD